MAMDKPIDGDVGLLWHAVRARADTNSLTRFQGDDPLVHPNDARREDDSRLSAAYWCEAVAYLPASGHSFWLAACPVSSPREALCWLADRAERLAEQLDASAAEAARGWLGDALAHERMLLAL